MVHTRTGPDAGCPSTIRRRNDVASTQVIAQDFSAASAGLKTRSTDARPGARTRAKPYADPYVTGVALGLVLLSAFVLTGRGLGASGAFATTAAGTVAAVAPARAAANPYFSRYLSTPDGPWREWLLFEIAGVVVGGFLSAVLAGRLRGEVEGGTNTSRAGRLTCAFADGGNDIAAADRRRGSRAHAAARMLTRRVTSDEALVDFVVLFCDLPEDYVDRNASRRTRDQKSANWSIMAALGRQPRPHGSVTCPSRSIPHRRWFHSVMSKGVQSACICLHRA